MQHFFDLDDIQAQDMPGRERKLIVGENMMLVFVEREGATEQDHTHDVEQFVLLLEGNARFTVGGETREVKAGQVVHIPKGVPHQLHADTPIRYMGIYTPLRDAVIKAEA